MCARVAIYDIPLHLLIRNRKVANSQWKLPYCIPSHNLLSTLSFRYYLHPLFPEFQSRQRVQRPSEQNWYTGPHIPGRTGPMVSKHKKQAQSFTMKTVSKRFCQLGRYRSMKKWRLQEFNVKSHNPKKREENKRTKVIKQELHETYAHIYSWSPATRNNRMLVRR